MVKKNAYLIRSEKSPRFGGFVRWARLCFLDFPVHRGGVECG